MRNCLFVLASLLSLVHGREYFIKKDQSDFVIDGKYLVGAHGGKNKEFWVCVDYEAVGEPYPESYGSRYPLEKCGGSPRTENNMYWYAIHGIWTSDDTLRIYFKSNFQLWPEINETKIMSSFFWTWRTISDEDTQFRVIQTHGITNYGEKRSDIDTLLLIGGGSVHVRGVKDGSTIHLRVKSESETGITLENVLETKYDSENHVFQTTETPLDSEESVTELSIGSDLLLAEKKATDETLFEEVTSSPTQWHVVDNEPAVRRKNDEPFIFIQVPNFEDGVQSRPTQNIPFVDTKTLGDPVYDQSSEESRRYRLLAKFENEIAEEETTTVESTTQQTSDETNNNVEDTVEFKKLYESLVDVKDSRYDYQLLYTVAIGTALAFFCFFILIVLFRCYAWDKTNKVSSFPAQPQQQHVVYTIGGMSMGALPIKVATQ